MSSSRGLRFSLAFVFLLLTLLGFAPSGLNLAPQLLAQATWSPIVTVGPGYVDSSTRQVVRTAGDVVYVVTNASGFDGGTALSSVRVYKGSPAGVPTSFTEMDAAHRPNNGTRIGGVEAKLAGADHFIQIVYEDISASQTKYVKFDTTTDLWGTPEVVGALSGQNTLNRYHEKTGLALDAAGLPHVITGGTNEAVYYTNRTSGAWSAPVVVGGSSSWEHPSMAFDTAGVLHVAFYDFASSMFYRNRSAAGTWSATETITTTASGSQSDESPSLAIDSTGRILVAYINGDFTFHYQLARRTAANTWADVSPTAAVAGHSPGVYIDVADNLYAMEGHDLTAIQPSVEIRSAAGAWGAYSILATSPPTRDGSASVRWDMLWPGNTAHVDWVNMDESGVDASGNHYGVTYYLHGAVSGTAPPPPTPTPTPTPTPPPGSTFALTLPSGSVSITAGQGASMTLTIGASGGFNQTVALSCSGAPAGATCGVSPASVNPNGGSATAQVSITSTARTASVWLPPVSRNLWPTAVAMLAGICLLGLGFAMKFTPIRRLRLALASIGMAALCLMLGCGGGGNTVTSGGGGGTPPGTFSLVVTGTSGTQSKSTTLTLVVK